MSNTSRHLEVVYCDDIREEVGSKSSFMGVYIRELTVPIAPILLPKLCIAVKAVADVDDPFESLIVRIVMIKGDNETELISTGPIPIFTAVDMPARDAETTSIFVLMNFMLAPFQIDEETTLRVKATTEREELRGAALRIRIVPPPAVPTIQ